MHKFRDAVYRRTSETPSRAAVLHLAGLHFVTVRAIPGIQRCRGPRTIQLAPRADLWLQVTSSTHPLPRLSPSSSPTAAEKISRRYVTPSHRVESVVYPALFSKAFRSIKFHFYGLAYGITRDAFVRNRGTRFSTRISRDHAATFATDAAVIAILLAIMAAIHSKSGIMTANDRQPQRVTMLKCLARNQFHSD